jgi:APA family basic amino acid/polyamine antiporter
LCIPEPWTILGLQDSDSPSLPTVTDNKPALLRVLGVAFGVAILIGNTISTGILRTPGEVAAAMPSAPWFLGVWAAGGLYAMLGALTLAELSVMIPQSGGNYVFARRAFGEYPGFLIGWTDWLSCGSSVALASITLGELATQVFPTVGSLGTIVAVGVVLLFTAIQWPGTKQSDLSQQLLSVLKVLALMVIAVVALSSDGAAPAATPPALPTGLGLVTALVLVFQSVLYTYDGWNGVAYFGGEMNDPGKQIPRAMAYGVLAVVAVYLALNAAFLHILGIEGLAGAKFAAADTAKAVFGSAGETVVRLVMAVTMLGGANAVLMIAARIPYAMASDGLLPASVARINAGGTPVGALAASAVVCITLILSGTFNQVLALATFFYVLQYAANFLAIFILRRTEPDTPRPYRAWGYPVVPAIVLVGALAFLGSSFKGDYVNSMRALWVIAGSVPVYFVSRRLMRSGLSS